jgi:hypothetical protein
LLPQPRWLLISMWLLISTTRGGKGATTPKGFLVRSRRPRHLRRLLVCRMGPIMFLRSRHTTVRTEAAAASNCRGRGRRGAESWHGFLPRDTTLVRPAYKVVRNGALAEDTKWKDWTVIDGILGIDVSKNTLDATCLAATRCAQGRLQITVSTATSSTGTRVPWMWVFVRLAKISAPV